MDLTKFTQIIYINSGYTAYYTIDNFLDIGLLFSLKPAAVVLS